MGYVSLYATFAGRDEALAVARALVEERLAACANLLDGVTSVYRWEGRIEQGREVALIVKTRAALAESVIARIRDLHSYACPCIVAWPIVAGYAGYLDWIAGETQ